MGYVVVIPCKTYKEAARIGKAILHSNLYPGNVNVRKIFTGIRDDILIAGDLQQYMRNLEPDEKDEPKNETFKEIVLRLFKFLANKKLDN